MAKTKSAKYHPPAPPPNRLASVFDDPPRNNVFLLTCMDQRLLDETVRFMNALNLQNRYDQVSLAGGAMGAHRLSSGPHNWGEVYFHHLKEAIDTLHRPIKDVFLFEHLDCGAYKYLHPDDALKSDYINGDLQKMFHIHRTELRGFATEVDRFIAAQPSDPAKQKAEDWKDIRVSYFVIDLLGTVTQLDVPDNQSDTLVCRSTIASHP
jgi:hypothetical protein